MSIWLIGAGPHACEYAKVLKSMGLEFEVIGRSTVSAKAFEAATGCPVHTGGLTRALAELAAPTQAIVAVSFEQLAGVAVELIGRARRQMPHERPVDDLCQ